MKAIAFNASPRKKHNTATMLQSALDGAKREGFETELIHLNSYKFSGCVSCYGCKRLGGKNYGKCAINDSLSPLLEKALEADVLFLGSPVYLSAETALFRAFFERLIYPNYAYDPEKKNLFTGKMTVGLIYTMGIDDERFVSLKYDDIFDHSQLYVTNILGSCERVVSKLTRTFDDPSKFHCPGKNIPLTEKRHKEIFPKDCENAFAMGQRLAILRAKME